MNEERVYEMQKYTDSTFQEEVLEKFNEEKSATQIATELHCYVGTVIKALLHLGKNPREHGAKYHCDWLNDMQDEIVDKLFNQGRSITALAVELEVSRGTLRRRLVKWGLLDLYLELREDLDQPILLFDAPENTIDDEWR